MIAFAGLSHLSLCTGISLASTGERVLFVDEDADKIEQLKKRDLPLFEPQLQELLEAHFAQLTFSTDFSLLKTAKLVYLAKDIVTNEANQSDLSATLALLEKMKGNISTQVPLVIHNQVRPGFCRKIASDFKKFSVPVIYQVETLIFGQAVSRVLHPERYIIGLEDPQSALPDFYQRLLQKFGCPILPMRYESAELAKLSINIYLCASVSVSNALSEVAEVIGADWEEIIPVLKLDKRIGPHAYLAPGLGISGGNLERDMIGIKAIAQEHGLRYEVVDSFLTASRARKNWAMKKLYQHVLHDSPRAKVAIWGLAYKKGTTSTKNSPALELLQELAPFQLELTIFDPVIPPPFGKKFKSALECASGAEAIVLMTDWEEFQKISIQELRQSFKGKTIIDPLGVLKKHGLDNFYTYIRPGVSHAEN